MVARIVLLAVTLNLLAAVPGSTAPLETGSAGAPGAADERSRTPAPGAESAPRAAPGGASALATQPQQPANPSADAAPRRPISRVTAGSGTLPNEQGQLYREYDISPYTLRVTRTNRPEPDTR